MITSITIGNVEYMVSDYEYYLITPYAIRAALLKPTLCNKCELYDSETEIYVVMYMGARASMYV